MPRKTLILISALILVTIVLFVVALRSTQTPTQPTQQPAITQQTPAVPVHSLLSIAPNPVEVKAYGDGSANVMLTTNDNAVTGVQLEISYDPAMLSNVKITAGSMFEHPVVLINKNDTKNGRLTYAIGIAPNSSTLHNTGTAAVITFTAKNAGQTSLNLLPISIVTASGVSPSVLKSATGATVVITQ